MVREGKAPAEEEEVETLAEAEREAVPPLDLQPALRRERLVQVLVSVSGVALAESEVALALAV